jgi:sugar/nucleoside kinase (ribokinase family)
MDSPDDEYGTVMAKVLREAQKFGIKTSIDVVSEDSDRYKYIVPPALRYCNYAILNEIEAGKTVGISPRQPDGTLIWESLPKICSALLDLGVSEYVILHCPETGVWMDKKNKWIGMRSLSLPEDYIKGSVGAGDAFSAGILYSLYNGLHPHESLKIANCAAAGCLSSADGTGGVGTIKDMLKLYDMYSADNDIWN